MPLYVRVGMQALYHGREQAKLLETKRVEELFKVGGVLSLASSSPESVALHRRRPLTPCRSAATKHQARHRVRLSRQRPAAHPELCQDVPH